MVIFFLNYFFFSYINVTTSFYSENIFYICLYSMALDLENSIYILYSVDLLYDKLFTCIYITYFKSGLFSFQLFARITKQGWFDVHKDEHVFRNVTQDVSQFLQVRSLTSLHRLKSYSPIRLCSSLIITYAIHKLNGTCDSVLSDPHLTQIILFLSDLDVD